MPWDPIQALHHIGYHDTAVGLAETRDLLLRFGMPPDKVEEGVTLYAVNILRIATEAEADEGVTVIEDEGHGMLLSELLHD